MKNPQDWSGDNGKLTATCIAQSLRPIRALSPFWRVCRSTVATDMLALEALAPVAFLCIALLVRRRRDIDITMHQPSAVAARAESMRSFAITVVETGHDLDAIDVRVGFGRRVWVVLRRLIRVRLIGIRA